jgi:hypothetical protein
VNRERKEVFIIRTAGTQRGGCILEKSLFRNQSDVDFLEKRSDAELEFERISRKMILLSSDEMQYIETEITLRLLLCGNFTIEMPFFQSTIARNEATRRALETELATLVKKVFHIVDTSIFKVAVDPPGGLWVNFHVSIDPPGAEGFGIIKKAAWKTEEEIEDERKNMIIIRDFE